MPVPAEDLPANLVPSSDLPDDAIPAPSSHAGMSHTAPAEPEGPSTTFGGMAASAARGVGPYAAGAVIGAPFGGPVGAAAGAGLAGATQAATTVYNMVAPKLGWPKSATPQEMTDKVMDYFGIKRPQTGAERIAEAMAGGAAGAATGAAAAGQLANLAASPVTRAVAGKMAEGLGRQVVSGAMGGAGAQIAAEHGAGQVGQFVASLATGGLPYTSPGARAVAAARPSALEARMAGYVLPPSSISEKPGMISNILAGWSGKIKTQQAASAKNQAVTNTLATKALGLPPDTALTEEVFNKVRSEAGKAYEAVSSAVPVIRTDKHYQTIVDHLGGKNSQAAQFFPKITDNPGIKELVKELSDVKAFPTPAGIEVVKELRFNANANLKAIGDPSRHALGLAQREAANAVDDLMERNIEATGQTGVVAAYRNARKLIAKAYDVEGATNSATGDVNARGLARLQNKGRPLTDELKTVADAASAFPKAMQSPSGFGDNEQWSALDFFGSAAAMAHGNPSVAGAILARPLARSIVLSQPYQRAMTNARAAASPLPLLMQPGMWSVTQPSGQVGSALGVTSK